MLFGREEPWPQDGTDRAISEKKISRAKLRLQLLLRRLRELVGQETVIRVDRIRERTRHGAERTGVREGATAAELPTVEAWPSPSEQRVPAHLPRLWPRLERKPDGEIGHAFDHPLEVVGRERIDIHVRRRIHEIDRVGNAVADRELDRIHVIAERPHEGLRVSDHARTDFGAQVGMIEDVATFLGIVLGRENLLLTDADAPDELLPPDELLNHHRQQTRVVIVMNELVEGMADVDFFPPASMRVLQHTRQPDVFDDSSPIEWVDKIS